MGTESRLIGSRFEMTEMIGQGGMGEVWRGVDTVTGDAVAIKVLKNEVVEQDETLLERFTREGEALRKLNHPNIVKMLAAVEENEKHYLIMEYVAGGDLYHLMKQQPQMPVMDVLEIALDLADALTRAHRLKIIHRDIKPPNVLIAEDGTPRLTDFGVARVDDRTRMTETGSLIGTYAYISPEALDNKKIDERADIWAFGIMLYEMLAGTRPFAGDSVTAVLRAIISNPVPDITQLRDDVPQPLIDLVSQMLEKDRDQRIGSIRQVGAELESILRRVRMAGEPTEVERKESRFPTTPTPTPTEATVTPDSPTRTPGIESRTPSTSAVTADTITISKKRAVPGLLIGAVLIVAVTLAVVYMLLGRNGTESDDSPQADTILTVEPVAPDEYMVLVADMEPIDVTSERDVSRFIVDDLTAQLENGVPFSAIRIRYYPQVITSAEAARAAAEANTATLVVWGNYTPEFVEVNIQLGVTDAFPHIEFERELLEQNSLIRLRMSNERTQSIATGVVYSLTILQNADGDGYEVSRSMVVYDSLDVISAEPIGNEAVINNFRFFGEFFQDPARALPYVDAAINVDRGNPLPYTSRAAAYIRLGRLEDAQRDIQTAQRLGTDGWTLPIYMMGNIALIRGDVDMTIEIYSQIIEARPEDWFAINFRGAIYYLKGDYELAKADYDRALSLEPTADFPYAFSIMLALREGRIQDAATYLNIIITQFPDTSLSQRMIEATGTDQIIFGPLFPAFGNLILGQYQDALENIDAAIAIDPTLTELYLMQGLAYCNLDDFEAAEAAYTTGIELDPDFAILYLLRSDARQQNGNFAGALEDLSTAQTFDLGEQYATLIEAGLNGEVTCKSFFDYQP